MIWYKRWDASAFFKKRPGSNCATIVSFSMIIYEKGTVMHLSFVDEISSKHCTII
jgi:hypothetical protein